MKYSRFLAFIFSFIPGAGQMYLGLMNRGLVIMSTFSISILLTIITEGIFAPVLAITWFFSFFDCLQQRRLIRETGMAQDTPILNFPMITLNKVYIGWGLILLGGYLLVVELIDYLEDYLNFLFPLVSLLQNLLVGAVLVFVGFHLLKGKKEPHQSQSIVFTEKEPSDMYDFDKQVPTDMYDFNREVQPEKED